VGNADSRQYLSRHHIYHDAYKEVILFVEVIHVCSSLLSPTIGHDLSKILSCTWRKFLKSVFDLPINAKVVNIKRHAPEQVTKRVKERKVYHFTTIDSP
jgi:hypothetical protein